MSLKRLLYVIGAVIAGVGVSMLAAVVVALIYQEWSDAGWIAVGALIAVAVGLVAWRSVGRPGELTTREGFAAVALSWVAMCVFGTLPMAPVSR